MLSHQIATYATLALASLTIGYWIGVGSSLPISRSSDNKQYSNTESDEDDDDATRLRKSQDIILEELKMVMVVRTDLGMTTGKIAAQCSHATLACYKSMERNNPYLLRQWERTGQTKVALRCRNEEELDTLEATAKSLSLCAHSIYDAGRTQVAAGSRTVLAVGPGPARLVNQVTGKLRLL